MKKAVITAGAAICMVAASPVAHAADNGVMHVRLWRHVVHEPGTLRLTVTSHDCIHDVEAYASTTAGRSARESVPLPVSRKGHSFSLTIRFSADDPRGAWDVYEVFALSCSGKGYLEEWSGKAGFFIRS